MAALTWRNVAAPNFAPATDALRTASGLFNNAFGGLKETLGEYDDNVSDRVNSSIMAELSKIQDVDAAKGAASRLLAGVDTSRLTADTFAALNGRAGDLLARNRSEQQLEQGQVNLEESKFKFGELRDGVERMKAFAPVYAGALQASASGTPEGQAQASKMISDFAAANNLRPDELLKAMEGSQGLTEGAVGLAGDRQSQRINWGDFETRQEKHGWDKEDRKYEADAMALANTVFSQADNAESALYALERNSAGLNPRVVAMARDMVSGQFGGLYSSPSGGGIGDGSGAGGAAGGVNGPADALGLIRGFEGFREGAYWDVDHFRVGYGSDTITLEDGTVVKTQKGSKVSRADAERDLARRVGDLQTFVAGKAGDGWNDLSDGARSAITSVAYNYGQNHKRLAPLYEAARKGDNKAVARIIRSFGSDNGGVNRDRRNREADLILNGGMSSPEARAVSAEFSRGQMLTPGTRKIIEGLEPENARLSSAEVTTQLREGVFNDVPVDWINRQINSIVKRSEVDGVATLNPYQAGQILVDNYGESHDNFVTRAFTELFDPSSTSNIGTSGRRIDDSGVDDAIQKARKGDYRNTAVNAANTQVSEASVKAAEAAYQQQASRVQELEEQFARGRDVAVELMTQRAKLAALEAKLRQAGGSFRRSAAGSPVRDTEARKPWRMGDLFGSIRPE